MIETDPPALARTPGEELSPGALSQISRLLSGLDRLDPILDLPAYPEQADPGVPFARYWLPARLGSGAYGTVLLAEDPQLGRRVVVKVPQPVVLTDPEARERFVREARAAAVLDHPGIVPVFEAGELGGLPYFTAGFVNGPTLASWLTDHKSPIPAPDAALLVRSLARAVHHAHERGILHCDLKPANILLPQVGGVAGLEPVVTDFGLARVLSDDPATTRSFGLAGTPLYMSPEQARGDRRALTARTDVYSLGVIFYELLTRRRPFEGESGQDILVRVQTESAPCPRSINPTIPRDLRAVCLRCLATEPRDRYPSAAALADDLDRFLVGQPVEARPISMPARLCRWVRRQPAAAAALLMGLAVTATAISIAAERWASDIDARAKLAVESAEREAAQTRLRLEETDKANAQVRADAAEFTITLERLRQKRTDRVAGWVDSNLADIRRLLQSRPSTDQIDLLRSEAALALGGIDLGEPRMIAEGFRAYAPAFTTNGPDLVALGSKYPIEGDLCEVRIFDKTTGQEVRRLKYEADLEWEKRHGSGRDGCRSIVNSFYGDWLVLGTRSGSLIRWDLRQPDPKPIRWRHAPKLTGGRAAAKTERVLPLAFDGQDFLWSGNGKEVKRWNPKQDWNEVFSETGKPRREVARSAGPGFLLVNPNRPAGKWPMAVAIDEDFGATWDEGTSSRIGLYDRLQDSQVARLTMPDSHLAEDHEITDLLFNWDATVLATAADYIQHLKLWDPVAGRLLSARKLTDDSDVRLAFSRDNRTLAATDANGTLLFTYRRSSVADVYGMRPGEVEDADVSSNGWHLVTTSRNPIGTTDLNHWNIAANPRAGRPERFHHLEVPPGSNQRRLFAVSANGQQLATVLQGELWLWDMPKRDRRIAKKIGPTRAIAFAPGGAIWLLGDSTLSRWPEEKTLPIQSPVELTAFSVSDEDVILGRLDGTLCRYALGGKIEPITQLGRDALTAVAHDGRRVIAGTRTGDLYFLHDGVVIVKLPNAHTGAVTASTVNPSGWFATGSEDRTVRVWNPQGKLVLTLPQSGKVRRVFWRQGGKLLILVEGERGLRVWNMDELKKELTTLGIDPALP